MHIRDVSNLNLTCNIHEHVYAQDIQHHIVMWQLWAVILVIVILIAWFNNHESFIPRIPQRKGVILESGLNSAKIFTLPNAIEAK